MALLEVRDVVPGPASLLLVPPDVAFPLRPRLAGRVGRGAVVEDATVRGPRPRPLERHPALLPVRRATGRAVLVAGMDPAIDPAAARRRAVGLQLGEGRERATLRVDTVDLAQHGRRTRLRVRAVGRQLPPQLLHRPVPGLGRLGETLADPQPEVVGEPQVGAPVAGGLDGLRVPLQETLRVREGAVLLDVRGRREEEDLGAALLGPELARLDLGAVGPERGRLDLVEVADDEPVELREREPVQPGVRRADGRVLAEKHVPLHRPVEHRERRLVGRVVARQAREVVEAEVVLRRRVVAPPRPDVGLAQPGAQQRIVLGADRAEADRGLSEHRGSPR